MEQQLIAEFVDDDEIWGFRIQIKRVIGVPYAEVGPARGFSDVPTWRSK
jgi:hypothetical protein